MARSLPRVRPGVLARSENLLEANIRMFLVDQMLKNDDEPIAVSDLVNLTKEPRDRVLHALDSMTLRGHLSYPSGKNWSDVDTFEINQFKLHLSVAERTDESK